MQSVVFRRAVRAASVAIVILWAVGASGTARGQVDGIEDLPRRVQVPAPVPDDSFRKPQFLRGDTNRDGIVDIADPVFELFHLFVGTVQMGCLATGDTNADRLIDVSDAVYGLEFLFLGKAPPPAPGPHECGVDPTDRWLPCEEYDLCGDDFLLITHVLNRVTFGPTLDLLSRIQTRDDLVRYIEQQLDPPTDYDPAIHEPDLAARTDALNIGFRSYDTANAQSNRLEAMLIENGVHSEWQLLHVLTQFWNNHFHTQIGTLPQSFFGRGGRGGGDGRTIATRAMFTAIDGDADGSLSEQEWNTFRTLHPAVMPYSFFGRVNQDGVNVDEFLQRRVIAYWKYARGGREQFGIAADMERREYRVLRRRGLGRFRDLLHASAKGVAMLIYLNTFENTVLAANENYGREFLELSSLGVDWMYTQRDIEEISKIFTGWTVGWVQRTAFAADDDNFQNRPDTRAFSIGSRGTGDFPFPDTTFWNDAVYTWSFIFGHREGRVANQGGGHDWTSKTLFLSRYGGTDSLGNPLGSDALLQIANNPDHRSTEVALNEFDLVLDRVVGFRDCAKFIATKLLQKFVTDDLNQLAKTYPLSDAMKTAFASVDQTQDGNLDPGEWAAPIRLILPNGRPPDKFEALDANGDGLVSLTEYQEPDLLVDAIKTWQETDGDMREVLRTILLSDEFLSLRHYRSKVKTPLEVVISATRILDASFPMDQLLQTANDITLAGMELFDFGDPTGESELAFDWMHTVGLLERLKFINRGVFPASNAERRFTWFPSGFSRRFDLSTAERTVDFFNLLIHGGDILQNQRELAIEAYTSASFFNRHRAAVAFIMSLPQFQKQ